jgi:PleD family two-component response regulator
MRAGRGFTVPCCGSLRGSRSGGGARTESPRELHRIAKPRALAAGVQRRTAVIEDEPTIAASVAARRRAEGFEVETAAHVLEGMELCRRFRPDLVVLDLMLPGADGLEVCRQFNESALLATGREGGVDED